MYTAEQMAKKRANRDAIEDLSQRQIACLEEIINLLNALLKATEIVQVNTTKS